MRALVTGGAGFIGSNLARRLVREGHDVVVADAFLGASWTNLADVDADVVTLADRLDLAPIRREAERRPFDVVFHQAAMTGVIAADGSATAGDDVNGFLRNNVEQFRGLLDLAAGMGARVVWASSCSVYGRQAPPLHEDLPPDPLNVYAFSKVQCERLARRYEGLSSKPIVGLRYSNVYGPGEAHKGRLASMIQQLAMQMRAGRRPRIFRAGQQRRDFVYIEDVVEANLRAASAERSGVYNCGAGRSWSFNEMVDELNRALGLSLAPEYFDNPYGFTQDWTECAMARAGAALGFHPRYDLRQGVEAYAASGRLGMPA